MQELNRPQCIGDLPNKILELKQERLNLLESTKGHPKELIDLKTRFNTNLQENFINHYAKAKFLQGMLQEPPITVTKDLLYQMERSNQQKQDKLEIYDSKMERAKHMIRETEQNIMKESKKRTQVEQLLNDIEQKETEVEILKSELSIKGLTPEECFEKLTQQTTEIANISKLVDEKQELVEDLIWKKQKKQKTIDALKKKVDEKLNKAELIKKLNTERDETTEKKYYVYKDAIENIKRLNGIESIEYETFSLLHINCKNSIIIHIHIDLLKDKISDAYVTGADIKISDIVKIVKGLKANQGLSRLMLEIIARLK